MGESEPEGQAIRSPGVQPSCGSEQSTGAAVVGDRICRALFEAMTEGFAVHQIVCDAAGRPCDYRFLELNPAFERLTGLSRESVLGRLYSEVLPGNGNEWVERYGRVALTGEPLRFELHSTALDRDYAVYAFQSEPGQFATLFADITERKSVEVAALAREARIGTLARLYAVLSRVNEAIVRTSDEQSLCQQVCAILAGDEGGFPLVWIGFTRDSRVQPVAAAGTATEYVREIRVDTEGPFGTGPTGTAVREARAVVNEDFEGNPRTAPWTETARRHGLRSSSAFPLTREGRVIGVLTLYAPAPGAFAPEQVELLEALSADVSYALGALEQERRRVDAEHALRLSEQRLREADRHKDEFLAALSHELRNPLAPIRNSLLVLEQGDPGSEACLRARRVIHRQVDQLTRLVDDLLDLTRVSRGKVRLERERLDLDALLRQVVEDHASVFETGRVRFELSGAGRPVLVMGDRGRLVQVVGNLLQNAAKFTPAGGVVRVLLGIDAGAARAVLRVEDTGIGMDAETLAALFSPYMQAEASRKHNRSGLGLGLSLVHSLVALHDGTVTASSAGPGQGAQLVVHLPLAPV